MMASPSVPLALLKTLSALARGSLWLLLAATVLFLTAWGTLHWVIVPRIDDFRPLLEARTSALLGVELRIGAIKAQSTGLVPSFELDDVRLLDAQGRPALQLGRVQVALSPRSLWQLGFDQVYVERLQLQVRRDREGRIWVAGLDLSGSSGDGQGLADWFFSQHELVLQGGSIEWTDELRAAPPLLLQQVQVVLRNQGRRHEIHVNATPPALLGERLSLTGRFVQPLLSLQAGRWRDWEGQLYSATDRIDLALLRRFADLGADLQQGSGAVRLWADIKRGELQGAVVDLSLGGVRLSLGAGLEPLALLSLASRLSAKRLAEGFEVSARALAFHTPDGLHWPTADLSFQHQVAQAPRPARSELKASAVDLLVLARLAKHLPLADELRLALLTHAPKGQLRDLEASWQGALGAPSGYAAKGQLKQLTLSAAAPASGAPGLAWPLPGLQGATVEFDLNQAGGQANLRLEDGAIELPGALAEPRVPLAQLLAEVRWQIAGERLSVQLPKLSFSNADLQGEAQIKWEAPAGARRAGEAQSPGLLDLQATLSRAEGSRVHRYLPASLPQTRSYLRESITAGSATAVKIRLKGDPQKFPFVDPAQGQFSVSADLQNVNYAYAPRSLQAAGALPWPGLTQLNGALLIEGNQLQLNGLRARVAGAPGLQISRADAVLSNLDAIGVLSVNAQARGPLAEALGAVNGSPLAALAGDALSRAVVSGNADYKFRLTLPLANPGRTSVQGSVVLAGNDIQVLPETPRLTAARGTINFSDKGFAIEAGQARLFGGEARLEGGSVALTGVVVPGVAGRPAANMVLRASGTATAEGLRLARELGVVARLAEQASGSASYAGVLTLRQGEPELLLTSSLQGLGLGLPAPLKKSPESALPLRLEILPLATPAGSVRLRDQFKLELGQLLAMAFVRELGAGAPRVLQGSIAVGLTAQESAPMPDEGVLANINVPVLDLDAWDIAFTRIAGTPASAAADGPGRSGAGANPTSYLPTGLALRAQELTLGGRKFSNLVLGGSRDGQLWRANLDASELNGYLEYRPGQGSNAGRVYARLARLLIVPGGGTDIESLLAEQPASIPALDVVVADLVLRGKPMGRLEVDAVNLGASGAAGAEGAGREWRLNKLNLIMPEASLIATGSWANMTAVAPGQALRATPERRRTTMNFRLELADAGLLLARLGMKDVVRRGRGKMEGQVAWQGSPLTLDYPSMAGAFVVDIESGQFLKAEPGIAKLLGVLSLQALPRRLTLDFRDVFSEGFSFDFVRGDVAIEQGVARSNNLQLKGVTAAVLMDGRADLARETQAIRVVVVPELNAGTASLIASVINPAVGLGTFLAQWLLRRPLMDAATQEFQVDGSWADPVIRRVDRRAPSP